MRDNDLLTDTGYVRPTTGVVGQPASIVDDAETIDEQFPEEEKEAGDEMIAPDDQALLDAGSSPEFDHSLRKPRTDNET